MPRLSPSPTAPRPRAVVVGSGPNGLAAAITLAEAGWRVRVFEANASAGGAVRSGALTRPGFVHDLGSAVHPFGVGSPFLRSLPLDRYGLEWVHPDVPLAHPLDDGTAALLHRDLWATAAGLGGDARAYERLVGPVVAAWPRLEADVLRPLLHAPRHPFALAGFGLRALLPATLLARTAFRGEPARALFAGLAAHSGLALGAPGTSAVALVLAALGHAYGWPSPRGGAGALTTALVAHLEALGGRVVLNTRVERLADLPDADAILLDTSVPTLLALGGDRLPVGYRARLARFRPGPGAYKLDYALAGPVPWAAEAARRAGTVHIGGALGEIAEAEAAVARGEAPARPFVLVAQPTVFDGSRAPAGCHTLWAYAHVPNGYAGDYADVIEAQIERFAPGFRGLVLARHVSAPADLERGNANLFGGDVNGGAQSLDQLLARPVAGPNPYRTPIRGLYLCSASTPPGGGVHGMCGHHAARAVLRDAGA